MGRKRPWHHTATVSIPMVLQRNAQMKYYTFSLEAVFFCFSTKNIMLTGIVETFRHAENEGTRWRGWNTPSIQSIERSMLTFS